VYKSKVSCDGDLRGTKGGNGSMQVEVEVDVKKGRVETVAEKIAIRQS